MKKWTIETVVTQLRVAVVDATGIDIFKLDEADAEPYTVTDMLKALRYEAFLSRMPTISRKGEYPGQVSLDEIEEDDDLDQPSRGRSAG